MARRPPPPALYNESVKDETEIVMYLVARPELMSPGKLGVQCGHGTQLCIRAAERSKGLGVLADLLAWESNGCYTKIALKAGEKQLEKLLESLADSGIPHARVVDLGRTEVPAGTTTLVALGPVMRRTAAKHVKRLQAY